MQQDRNKLEKCQLEIARIITGARIGTIHKLVCRETNWISLQERQSLNKINSFSKIVKHKCPDYLKRLLPEKIGAVQPTCRNI